MGIEKEESMPIKRTPLFQDHLLLKAKMVPFAGWEMPVQYSGLREEHEIVRKYVGLFDVSHMGEIRVKGLHSLETLDWLTTNDVSKLQNGEAQYSLLPNNIGGLVDDIIVYCIKKNEDYLVCVNASNKDKDFAWITKNNKFNAEIIDESDLWGQIAVQGPNANELLQRIFQKDFNSIRPFTFFQTQYKGFKCIVATTGYTGEKGGEIFIEKDGTSVLWKALLEQGQDLKVAPIGLGARDTLRTEMKYSLYGHEIDDTTNPYAAGLGWVIKPQKKDFIGKEIIIKTKEEGLSFTLVGFKLLDKGIPRQGYSLFSFDNREMGKVTSGTLSPTLSESIGLGYVFKDQSKEGTEFWVDIRGRKAKAVVVKTPFVHP
jgi:aminomethyltransferase